MTATTFVRAEGATRPEFLELADTQTEVLIVGGGINGLSVMRDLALQGVRVLLIDRGDVMSGASAASSHMIHGGIRYLENGEFRLVRESVQERNDLLVTAPHVVKPLRTTVPMFSLFSGVLHAPLRMLSHRQGKQLERGAFLIAVGLVIYESFSRGSGSMPRFVFRGRRESLLDMPSLNPRVKYSASYFDASVHKPERLALDVMADALATGNARVVTYAEAVGSSGGMVLIRDALTHETVSVSADVVVNASGPFTDMTNSALGIASHFMGGTKGSHIVVDHAQLFDELNGRELFFENCDGRIVLIYPVKGRVLIGTTDIFADASKPAICTDEEVTYFFDLVRHILPGISLDRSQIVFRFSGIRPLPRQEEARPGFVSRDYRIVRGTLPASDEIPLLSIVGGKWTTFRALGEQVSLLVLNILSRERTVSTHGLAIGGGKNYPQTPPDRENWLFRRESLIPRDRLKTLLERYGSRADDVIQALLLTGDLPLASLPSYSAAELGYLISVEKVVRLDDILLRRTSLGFAGELTDDRVNEIADIAAKTLSWSNGRRDAEVARVWKILHDYHGVESPVGLAHQSSLLPEKNS
jgi:glycerol-3-phosphate dehydrogenase